MSSVTTTYLKKDMNAKVDGVELSTGGCMGHWGMGIGGFIIIVCLLFSLRLCILIRAVLVHRKFGRKVKRFPTEPLSPDIHSLSTLKYICHSP